MGKICFGVDLGGTTVKMGIFTVDGAMLEEWEIPTRKDDGGKYILSDIADSINDKITTAAIDRADVVGVGIGVPGPVTSAGIVKGCVNLGWGDTPVEESLKDKTGFIVKAGNDANVAALGELWQGGGKGFNSLVMVTLYTGRHHQIRVQMSHAGMSLIGDYKYADRKAKQLSEELGQKQVALCAYELGFLHPMSGKELVFRTKPTGEIFQYFL